jgi:hypothetical protein
LLTSKPTIFTAYAMEFGVFDQVLSSRRLRCRQQCHLGPFFGWGGVLVIDGEQVSDMGTLRFAPTSFRTAERSKVDGLEHANATLLAKVTFMQVETSERHKLI